VCVAVTSCWGGCSTPSSRRWLIQVCVLQWRAAEATVPLYQAAGDWYRWWRLAWWHVWLWLAAWDWLWYRWLSTTTSSQLHIRDPRPTPAFQISDNTLAETIRSHHRKVRTVDFCVLYCHIDLQYKLINTHNRLVRWFGRFSHFSVDFLDKFGYLFY